MILFVILLILFAAAAQLMICRKASSCLKADFHPEVNVVEQDRNFDLCLSVQNNSPFFLPYIRLELPLYEEMFPQSDAHIQTENISRLKVFSCSTWLKAHQKYEYHLPIRLSQRGRCLLPHMTVSTGDFLGIHEEKKTLDRFCEVVAAPKPFENARLTSALGGFTGDLSVRRYLYEDPVLTVGFREYTGHEPMKMISWSQSARTGEMMVRNFDHTTEFRADVLLNIKGCGPDAVSGDIPYCLEELCSIARSVCDFLEEKGISYRLKANGALAGSFEREDGCSVEFGAGAYHHSRVLELLGRLTGQPVMSLEKMASTGSRNPCGIILITSETGKPSSQSLEALKSLSDGLLLILTPEEYIMNSEIREEKQ